MTSMVGAVCGIYSLSPGYVTKMCQRTEDGLMPSFTSQISLLLGSTAWSVVAVLLRSQASVPPRLNVEFWPTSLNELTASLKSWQAWTAQTAL